MSEIIERIQEIEREAAAFRRINIILGNEHETWAGDVLTQEQLIRESLQELADRRQRSEPVGGRLYGWTSSGKFLDGSEPIPAPGVEPSRLAYCADKVSTYDERDMMTATGQQNALHFAADHFYKLRAQMFELGLLSPDASDQTAYVAIRDAINIYKGRKLEQHPAYRPFEEPSSKA